MTEQRGYKELVTHAYLTFIEMPLGAGTMALITLDNGRDHTRPNSFGLGGVTEIGEAFDKAAANPAVTAIAVTGKPFSFAAGADLAGVGQIVNRDMGLALGRLGHAVFRKFRESSVPTFAFINGVALGGGFELPLNCQYRTLTTGPGAYGLPEVGIGLIPGWGGAYLTPNLVGPEKAVKVILETPLSGRVLTTQQTAELGLVDAVFEAADFLEQSIRWAAQVVTGAVTVSRPEIDRDETTWAAAVAKGRAFADAKTHGLAPNAYRALDLIAAARTADLDTAYAAEDEALSDMVLSDVSRAQLYGAFQLVQLRAKKPAGVPKARGRAITMVGVVGAGLMASQLALLFVRRLKVPVVMTDVDQARVDKGVAYVRAEIAKLVTKGRISNDEGNRLTALVSGSLDKAAFAKADWVIEAVFEDLKVKKQVFAEVEAVVSETCVLATNTSSLSVTEMAADLEHPERVVGFHFFTPVAVMPLLEIARGERTDDETVATAFAVGKSLRKTTVGCADAPAFIVNRLLMRTFSETWKAIDAGTPVSAVDAGLRPLGQPMKVLDLLELTGLAVPLHVMETMHAAFPERFRVSEGLARVVSAGKTSVYRAAPGGGKEIDPEVAALLAPQGEPAPWTAQEVHDRTAEALADEIRIMLDEGVVAEVQDIDLSMIMGAGWAIANGGITPYLDRIGVSEKVTGRRFLPPGVASVPVAHVG